MSTTCSRCLHSHSRWRSRSEFIYTRSSCYLMLDNIKYTRIFEESLWGWQIPVWVCRIALWMSVMGFHRLLPDGHLHWRHWDGVSAWGWHSPRWHPVCSNRARWGKHSLHLQQTRPWPLSVLSSHLTTILDTSWRKRARQHNDARRKGYHYSPEPESHW